MSASFALRSACVPFALSRLFGETYDAMCWRIKAAGGEYQAVTCDVLHRVLAPLGMISARSFAKRPLFNRWRPQQGRWVAIVVGWGSLSAHCITLQQGVARDNGWACEWDARLATLRVLAAWQLQEAA